MAMFMSAVLINAGEKKQEISSKSSPVVTTKSVRHSEKRKDNNKRIVAGVRAQGTIANAISISEFRQRIHFIPGTYFDIEDKADCPGGKIQILSEDNGGLSLQIGSQIIFSGISRGESSRVQRMGDCETVIKTVFANRQITSNVENKCKNSVAISSQQNLSFISDKNGFRIQYLFSSKEGNVSKGSTTCTLVREP